jgi:hypothetical protein
MESRMGTRYCSIASIALRVRLGPSKRCLGTRPSRQRLVYREPRRIPWRRTQRNLYTPAISPTQRPGDLRGGPFVIAISKPVQPQCQVSGDVCRQLAVQPLLRISRTVIASSTGLHGTWCDQHPQRHLVRPHNPRSTTVAVMTSHENRRTKPRSFRRACKSRNPATVRST